jgi:hypothetical protein
MKAAAPIEPRLRHSKIERSARKTEFVADSVLEQSGFEL